MEQRVLRYIGPTDPVYGGRGPTSVAVERKKLKDRQAGKDQLMPDDDD